jgi:two-component system OmpR family sensor kinase
MKLTKSIQWRLLLWIAFLLGLVLLALDFAAYEIHFTNRVSQLDEELHRRAAVLRAAFSAPTPEHPMFAGGLPGQPGGDFGPPSQWPDDSGNSPPRQNGHRDLPLKRPGPDASWISATTRRLAADMAAGYYFSIWTRENAAPYWQSTNCPAGNVRPLPASKDAVAYTRTRDGCREVLHATEFGDCILVGRTLAPVLADTRLFVGWLVLGSLVMLAFGLGGSWFIVASALRPVEKISAAAVKISSGDLSQRISVTETGSELGQLADVLNSTFARLEAAFAQQKHFTTDAAHELRTPLTALISEAQITLARERAAADYKEALAASLDIAQQMRRLTDSLLELARFDAGQEKLTRQKIDLSAVAEDCVKFVIPLAASRQLQFLCDLAPAEVFADPGRMTQVVTNLLTNAIHYNRDGGKIHVTTCVENHAAVLSVADTGCGISAADLPHVFERFYRADKSRSTGGLGLGLAITKAIVTVHGGTIEVTSQKNVGTKFSVRLPCS